MKEKKKNENRMPSGYYTAMAENARSINDFASLGFQGQQMLLTKLASLRSEEDKRREIEELTR